MQANYNQLSHNSSGLTKIEVKLQQVADYSTDITNHLMETDNMRYETK